MTRKVLVIDDQPLEGEMIEHILRRARPDVIYCGQALTASDGIRMASEREPDLIFLDIRMPGMDGLSAIAPLREACPQAQIVMLTAFDDFDSLRTAMRASRSGRRTSSTRSTRATEAASRRRRPSAPMCRRNPPRRSQTPSASATGRRRTRRRSASSPCPARWMKRMSSG